jgi:putative mycofactocin binding protein MftB
MGATMRLAKHVKFREEKFGGVLFETRSEKVFTLNATAAAVVREITAGHDQKEIAARLADRFSGPPADIEREVAGLIGDLQQKGLVEDSARG